MRFRSSLLRLVLAATCPLLVLATATGLWTAAGQHETILSSFANTGRALQLAVDQELAATVATLEALALSPSLPDALAGNPDALHDYARSLVDLRPADLLNIALYDVNGRQVMNTLAPKAGPLPTIDEVRAPPDAALVTDPAVILAEVIASRRIYVTDLFWGPVAQEYLIGVLVPVIRDDRVVGVVTASSRPTNLGSVLRAQKLPDSWAASIIDRNGLIVTRQPGEERFVGQAIPNPLQREETAVETVFLGRSLEGVMVYASFHSSDLVPWTLVLSAPQAMIEFPLRQLLVILGIGGLTVVGLGAWAALALGRRMRREVEGLADWAPTVLDPADVPTLRASVGIREVAMVRDTLERANADLRRRSAEKSQAEAALRESEAQFRTLAETLPDLLFVTDTDGFNTYVNPGFADFTGVRADDLLGSGWLDVLHPEDRARAETGWERSLRSGSAYMAEYRLRRHDGTWRSFLCRGAPHRSATGEIMRWVGICTDVQSMRDTGERMRLLVREVDHRAKNALAVVQSVLRLSPTDDPDAFIEAVEGRIAAMARAHSLLSASQWSGARLEDLFSRELAAFRPSVRIEKTAPNVAIAAEATQAMAMVLHELATNAARHGALSRPEGRIDIGWAVEREPPALTIRWREQGGPRVAGPPLSNGFGMVLVRQVVEAQLDGSIALNWAADGLRCTLQLPGDCFIPGGIAGSSAPANAPGEIPSVVRGQLVLIVEDEAITALAMSKTLRDAGFTLLGPVGRVDDALDLLRTARPDVAVLDVNLFGIHSDPVAEALRVLHVPYLLCTGYGDQRATAPGADDPPVLSKPVSGADLVNAVARLVRSVETAAW